MNKIIGLSAVLMILLSSCSKYQKVLKSADYDYKFNKAKEYYDKEDYVKALPLFEELATVLRGTSKAEDCMYFFAFCNYGLEEYMLASYHFKNFYRIYPKSERAEEAMYLSAMCHYKDSPRFTLDQTNTTLAINEFQLFLTIFPNSSKTQECNEMIDKLRLKLQTKAYESAKLFYNMGDYKAAITSFGNVIKDFPESKYIEESMYLMLKSQFLLAKNSVESKQMERYEEVIKIYYKFADAYKESKFFRDAEQMFESSQKILKNNSNKNG